MKFPTAVKKKLIQFFAAAFLMLIPAISFCQPPGPGDENPDVPFDDNMNLIFLAAGIVFAVFIISKKLRKNAVA